MRRTLSAILLVCCVEPAKPATDANTPTNAPFDLHAYETIMSERVLSPAELSDWFHDSQFRWWPLVPPDPDFVLRFAGGDMLPFDPTRFPASFVQGLWPRDLLSVAAYDVTVVEDPSTRSVVVYNPMNQPILVIPPEPGYGGDDFALAHVPDLNSGRYGPESRAESLRLYDPARLQLEATLMPIDSLPYYLYAAARIKAASSKPAKPRPVVMKAYVGVPVTNLWFSCIELLTDKNIRLTLVYPWNGATYPAGCFTSRVDFLAARDIVDPWCDLLATTNVSASTNWIEWTDASASASNTTPRYYWAANADYDSDGDGFSNAREKLMYHSDPANSNSKPVSVSGTVTYGGVETGLPIRVLAVTASNSWATGCSVTLQTPGAYTNDRVATLLSYWFKAYVDVDQSWTREDWEPWGIYSTGSTYVTNNKTGINITIADVPSVWGTLSYTGLYTEGTVRVLAATASNAWNSAYSMNTPWRLTAYTDPFTGQTLDGSAFPTNYAIFGMPASNYTVKAFLDVDKNGTLAAPEPAGFWTNNPVSVTCRVTNVNILLDRDSDADGLPDWWELDNFGSLTAQTGAGDADGDGVSNLLEYQQGRDPNQGATTEGGGCGTVQLAVYTPME